MKLGVLFSDRGVSFFVFHLPERGVTRRTEHFFSKYIHHKNWEESETSFLLIFLW